jgi:3-phosphoshikimate 1-carboxyvinyltransferase
MDAVVSESGVAGAARAPPSKSYTHRAIFASAFADGATVVRPLDSADTRASTRAVQSFGSRVEWREDTLAVWGFENGQPRPGGPEAIDCANSGTTMRLATAVAALADGPSELVGDDSLSERPQGPLLDAIGDLGGMASSATGDGTPPIAVAGPIEGGKVSMPGDVSSQFVTALLMVGALTGDGISVTLETELKSAPYVDITLELLADFGVDARQTPFGYAVDGDQTYSAPAGGYSVPGDFSSMSYLLAAGAVAGEDAVTVEGAHPSAQGDAAIVDVLERMGATVDWDRDDGLVTVERSNLIGAQVSVADTPDLLPTIAVLGAVAGGTTRIVDAEHVRYKETDRVAAMAEELDALGAAVEEEQDTLVVHGSDTELRGARVDGRGDHRIVMALAVAGLVADGTTTVEGAEHVDVSFPGFFDVLEDLGASVVRRD